MHLRETIQPFCKNHDEVLKKRIVIVTTHPIQYNAPWFRLLAQENDIDLTVFYTWSQSESGSKYDPGFGRQIEWDLPLLDGYNYKFVKNISKNPGSHHFTGISNPTLIKEIEQWGPHAILVIGWSFKSHLACLRYFKKKIPVYFRGDSTLLDESGTFTLKKLVRKLLLSLVYKSVDKALYVGKNNRDYYQKFGLNPSQLVYAPHAIDNNRFAKNKEYFVNDAKTWRSRMGIKDHETVFLFAGKLELKKNPLLLLNAFKSAALPGSHLVFVGNGPLEQKLKEQLIVSTNIHFLPFQNQTLMPVVYRIGDVFVLPSSGPGETWGLAINEAMACERVIIASDKCGGAIDLIENDMGGYIFKSNSIDSLKDTLKKCYEKKLEFNVMGKFNYDKVQDFNFKQIVHSIQQQLQAL